jgi:hypothetical protein
VAKRFNLLCLVLAALWLFVTIPLGIRFRPTVPDFSQFYIGGILASRGAWNSLYPLPVLGGVDNAGLNIHSFAKPGWTSLCQKRGVADHTHFILPPPSALVFTPLAHLTYSQAFWLWTFFLIACTWGVAWTAGLILRQIFGQPSRHEGVLALLIAFSPMTARAIRIANVSPPIALLLGAALRALLSRERPLRGAWTVLLGATLKYATLILAPLLVAMRRWRTLFWLTALGAVTLLITVGIAGTEPFVEFYRKILPTLSRPAWYPGNQSLAGMLARIYGRPFTPRVSFALNSARVISLEFVLGLILTTRPRHWLGPANVVAAAGLLVSWLLVFSPIAWEHWPIFLCPVWGWLLWEARVPGLRRILASASLALMYLPAGIIQVSGFAVYPIVLPEPYNSTQLLGVALVMILAYWRLSTSRGSGIPLPVQEIAQVRELDQVQQRDQPHDGESEARPRERERQPREPQR